VALVVGVGVELERDEDVGREAEVAEVETGGEDTDDLVGVAAELDGLADDLLVAAEAAGPEAVAENRDFGAFGKVLFLDKRAAAKGGRAEQAKVIGADLGLLDLLGEARSGEIGHAAAVGGDILDDARLGAPVVEFGGGGADSRALWGSGLEEHEAVGLGERGGLEQDGIDDGEDGGVGSDTEGQGGHGGRGEAGVLEEHAHRVPDILEERFHGHIDAGMGKVLRRPVVFWPAEIS
jgi:hypothetical protein